MSDDNLWIQPFSAKDLPEVLAIERQSYPFPWSAEQFLQEQTNPVATLDLIWAGEQLAGYICYWLVVGEMQILNIAISPKFRCQGIAGRLLHHVFAAAQKKALERAWLEVRVSNLAAIALYRQQGFVAGRVRAGYYRDGEDALLMYRDFSGDSLLGN